MLFLIFANAAWMICNRPMCSYVVLILLRPMSWPFPGKGEWMPRRIFSNRAKWAWWSVHVKACRESGLAMSAYCCLHDLTRFQFVVWAAELDEWEAQKSKERRRWKSLSTPGPVEKRHRAAQAIWAMHVEAWQWSGLPLREYTSALQLSPYSLKRWRNLIESEEVVIDWRAMLHPSSMPPISTNISTRTKESERAKALTAAIEAEAGPPKRASGDAIRPSKDRPAVRDRAAWRERIVGWSRSWHRHQRAVSVARPFRSDQGKACCPGPGSRRRKPP